MQMNYYDSLGIIYDETGLRLGGFTTKEFNELTEKMEENSPGVREKIIFISHYQIFWLTFFPDLIFLISIFFLQSFSLAAIAYVLAYILEHFRFFIFGPSTFLAKLSFLWGKIKYFVYLLMVFLLWKISLSLSIIVAIFAFLEGFLGIGVLIMLPLCKIISSFFSKPQNIESYVLHWTILKEKGTI